jgi:predicted alpha/beta-fold hydrolase
MFIPRYTIYDQVDDYFAAYALVGGRLLSMAMPAYLIAAEDDPIIPVDDLKRIDPIDALHIETSRHGGHCGFIENLAARSWVETRMLQILEQHLTSS